MISLLSPKSLGRPWVNIELGAGWIRGTPIIPLCHSGLVVSALPRPFGDFNAVSLDQSNAATRLISGVAEALSLQYPKKLNFEGLLKEMREAAAGCGSGAATSEETAQTQRLSEEEIRILLVLAHSANHGSDDVLESEVASAARLSLAEFKYYADRLVEADYIYVVGYGEGLHYSIRPDGAGWLIKNKLMPK